METRIQVQIEVIALPGHDHQRFPIPAITRALMAGLDKFKWDAEAAPQTGEQQDYEIPADEQLSGARP